MIERNLQILDDLEAVRLKVSALSDEILLSIDHNHADSLGQGLLEVSNPESGRNVRRYRRPTVDLDDFFSNLLGKEPDRTP